MREEYVYRVHRLNPDGQAIVEYKHHELGSITKHIFLPYDRGVDKIHQKIIEEFPLTLFYSNYLRANPAKLPDLIEGKLSIDFDDFVYDFSVMCGEKDSH